jgi:hypothetical protein
MIDLEEFHGRSGQALGARTRRELAASTSDLPASYAPTTQDSIVELLGSSSSLNRTGTGLSFTKARVAEVRRNHRIPRSASPPHRPVMMATWSPSPRPQPNWAWGSPPSTGGCPTSSSPASS